MLCLHVETVHIVVLLRSTDPTTFIPANYRTSFGSLNIFTVVWLATRLDVFIPTSNERGCWVVHFAGGMS
jgi:hypothetical protein